jgi:precorrin-3B methylase
MRNRTVAAIGLSLAMLASAAVFGAPALSRGDVESRLRDFGVPADAEILAAQANADGDFVMVMYRDSSGQVETLGGIERLGTPPPGP